MDCAISDLVFCLAMGLYLGTFIGLVFGILIGRHTMRKERRQRWQGSVQTTEYQRTARARVSLTSRLQMSGMQLRLAEQELSATVTDRRNQDALAMPVGNIGYKTTTPDNHSEEDSIDHSN